MKERVKINPVVKDVGDLLLKRVCLYLTDVLNGPNIVYTFLSYSAFKI